MKHFLHVLLVIISLFIAGINISAQGPYAPGAGNTGSAAIYTDSAVIKSWATGIELKRGWVNIADTSVKYNGSNKTTFGYPAIALGQAQESAYDVVSLGDSGIAVLTFDRPIANGNGPDFAVFENGFYSPASEKGTTFAELAFVEVSSDGKRFVRFPAVSLTSESTQTGGFGTTDPTHIYNLAGKDIQGYGTPFDLDDIKDSAGIDLNNIRFVKVVDAIGDINAPYASYDSKGHVVNDPWPTPYYSGGFDLDGIGAVNTGQPYSISTFENLTLANDSYWYPSATSVFSSGLANFHFTSKNYNEYGFNYSNMRNDTLFDSSNMYSSITKGGISAPDSGGTNYACAYIANDWPDNRYDSIIPVQVTFNDGQGHIVSGFYATNSTYAYYSMKKGDLFAKKFGGKSGSDPDWFKLMVWGEKEDGSATDTVSFYLADYRFDDHTKDYIADTWQWVDLLKLGKVNKLYFSLLSTDIGSWGMNTPSIFCLDNLTVLPETAPVTLTPLSDVTVAINAQPMAISLGQAFTAYDTTGIVLAVASNTNTGLVSTSISGKTLTLSFTAGTYGEAEIVIRATLNNQAVTDTFTVTVDNTTGVNNVYSSSIKTYPNPFSAYLTVECEAGSQVVLFDIFGRKIKEQQVSNTITLLSAEDLAPGYYLLKIVNSSGTRTLKVLKQ
jgi:hypothetical protein